METFTGDTRGRVTPADVIAYLEWVHRQGY
jgi:hypothetical protein